MEDATGFADPGNGEAIHSPILRRLLAHWRALAAGRAYPHPRELDPVAISWALGRLTLIDVSGDGAAARFRYALCGDQHVAHFGNDLTGTWLDDNPNAEIRTRASAAYAETVRRRTPILSGRDLTRGPRVLRYQALILPLGDAAGRIERLIVAIDFEAPVEA
jgi:hypothetical protein